MIIRFLWLRWFSMAYPIPKLWLIAITYTSVCFLTQVSEQIQCGDLSFVTMIRLPFWIAAADHESHVISYRCKCKLWCTVHQNELRLKHLCPYISKCTCSSFWCFDIEMFSAARISLTLPWMITSAPSSLRLWTVWAGVTLGTTMVAGTPSLRAE